jgi:hypothetical protein
MVLELAGAMLAGQQALYTDRYRGRIMGAASYGSKIGSSQYSTKARATVSSSMPRG